MIFENYLIDVLSKLSVLVGCMAILIGMCMAILIGMAALFSALGESITSKPSKAKLVFCILVVFFCMAIFAFMPDEEVIRYIVAG